MSCQTRALRCLLACHLRAEGDRPKWLGVACGDRALWCRHVENRGCRGHLGVPATGGRAAGIGGHRLRRGQLAGGGEEQPLADGRPPACPPNAQQPTDDQTGPERPEGEDHQHVHVASRLQPAMRAAGITLSALLLVAMTAGPALAQTPPSLTQVLDAARNWLVTLLASLATLFLTVGGIRYMAGATDPGEVEKAKTALKAAAIGYALAALAPLAARILKQIVGV